MICTDAVQRKAVLARAHVTNIGVIFPEDDAGRRDGGGMVGPQNQYLF
jgi:hypothetical protein